jgi:hypothetical protein
VVTHTPREILLLIMVAPTPADDKPESDEHGGSEIQEDVDIGEKEVAADEQNASQARQLSSNGDGDFLPAGIRQAVSKNHSQGKQFKGTAQILANDMWTRTTPERIQLRQPVVLRANASADPTTVVELQRSALVAATPEF